MTMLDQVLLLEQKVESAVAKIQQLQAENDALRKQCSELTNALSSKTEQLSTFANDQNKIENGIQKALDRLNSIENSVLKANDQVAPTFQENHSIKQQINSNQNTQQQEVPTIQVNKNFSELNNVIEEDLQNNLSDIEQEDLPEEIDIQTQEEENPEDELGFDIF